MNSDHISLSDLSPAEKLQLIERLWDDLTSEPNEVPIPEWQTEELERRKSNLMNNPKSGPAWEEVKQEVRSRNGQ